MLVPEIDPGVNVAGGLGRAGQRVSRRFSLERIPSADLVLVHDGRPDQAAHRHGARSPEYHAAVARADDVIGRVVGTLDPLRDTTVVSSDHGHLDEGAHALVRAAAWRRTSQIPPVVIVAFGALVLLARRVRVTPRALVAAPTTRSSSPSSSSSAPSGR